MSVCIRCKVEDSDVHLRRLWRSGSGLTVGLLCDDCNGLVQGPDFLDVSTGNRVYFSSVYFSNRIALISPTERLRNDHPDRLR